MPPIPSTVRLVAGLSLLALAAACTAQPQYPIDGREAPGGGFGQVRPRYPVEQGGRNAAPPPRYAPPPASPSRRDEDDDAPRTAPSGTVSSRPLSGGSDRRARGSTSAATPGESRPAVLTRPKSVIVAPGQTLFDIAELYRTPVRALIEANSLQPPYALTPGSTLILPRALVYAVQEGDTLFGIARRFNIDPRSLANLNDIGMEAPMAPGRSMALPALARDQGANPQASGPSPAGSALGRSGGPAGLRGAVEAAAPPARPAPGGRTPRKTSEDARAAVAAAARETPSSAATNAPTGLVTDAQVIAAGRGRFIPPVRGSIISGFGVKAPGQRNDGVNIAAAQGTTVKAAAAGEVVYAGSAIPGFGNLVLVKHAGGWVTAYAHLDSIAVKMRSTVGQGDKLGEVGQSGGVDQPQLHFEIRYPPAPDASAKPVDPALLLPGLK